MEVDRALLDGILEAILAIFETILTVFEAILALFEVTLAVFKRKIQTAFGECQRTNVKLAFFLVGRISIPGNHSDATSVSTRSKIDNKNKQKHTWESFLHWVHFFNNQLTFEIVSMRRNILFSSSLSLSLSSSHPKQNDDSTQFKVQHKEGRPN